MRILFISLTSILLLCNSLFAWSHAEKGKPRFVAEIGVDQGKCENRFRPCRTIAYAVSQAHKGDKILVAKGSYQSGLEFLISELVPVYGGYNLHDNFQLQSPDLNPTFVTGVPSEYAPMLNQKGFNVIRDSLRAPNPELTARLNTLTQLKQFQADQTCIDGKAGNYPCHNISLKSHLPLSSFTGSHNSANDIWGHIDLNTGKEYAILGLQKGTAVIELSEPSEPKIIGVIGGQSSGWRDIKVYQYYQPKSQSWEAYAYVTTDNVANEGVAIIELSHLSQSQVRLVHKQQINNSAHNVYISGVDYGLNIATEGQTPLVHIAGADRSAGALRSYNLKTPENLGLEFDASGINNGGYSHDAASLYVNDNRKSQCPNANTQGCLVLMDYNEQEIHLWDQTLAEQRNKLSSTSYPQASYVHSGWWSEDKRYMFVHDEGDEQEFNVNSTVQIFDITNLAAPKLAKTWRGPTAAIDHNGFVRGNRYYMSNYERGLTVLDISNPEDPQEIGFFDTYPSSDNASFNGAWGTYPYLPSGLLLVSDINSGLYVLEDHTNDQRYNTVGFAQKSYSGQEGQTLNIEVQRLGDLSQVLTVSYQTLPGSASNSDFSPKTGTLNWNTNEADNKIISLSLSTDQLDQEISEQFFLRLFNPEGGTTLAKNNIASIEIQGLTNSGLLTFSQDEIRVRENQGLVQVSVNRNGGSSGTVSVNYELVAQTATLTEDVESDTGTLSWQAGDNQAKQITLSLIDDQQNEQEESFILRLSAVADAQLGAMSELRISIQDDESNQPPTASAGEDRQVNTRQTVQLTGVGQDPEQGELRYQWQQTSGPSVTLSNANEATASFAAPSSATTLTFELTVSDEFSATQSDSINISVQATTTPPQPIANNSSGGGSWSLWSLLSLLPFGVKASRTKMKV